MRQYYMHINIILIKTGSQQAGFFYAFLIQTIFLFYSHLKKRPKEQGMKAISLDLRQRIVEAYKAGEGT